ncbi:MAG: (2Fe-2S)-binding protein [Planctomycetota bacterium]|nr:(2Fe-2S)-binding protein [Planctomycetota bacterium]
MIVCSCQGVTEREVRDACQTAGLADACPAGKGCGGCVATILAIRDQVERDARQKKDASSGRFGAPNGQDHETH